MQRSDARYYREDRPNALPHVVEFFGEKKRFRKKKDADAFISELARAEA